MHIGTPPRNPCSAVLICLGLSLAFLGQAVAQELPRPPRRSVLGGAGGGAGTAVGTAPQPLPSSAKISGNAQELSVDVQEQELPVVLERIAALTQVEIKHAESIPNRRVSVRFTALPVAEGLRRVLRVAEVPGYMLVTAPEGAGERVQRLVFLPDEGTAGAGVGRPAQRPRPTAGLPAGPPPIPPPAPVAPPQTPPPPQEETKAAGSGTIFDEIKSNAAARRLLSQMMHPNEQVRERAMEGLVRIVREDDKQRALMELLEPLMDDLGSDDQATQDAAREEIRKLLSR